MEKGRKKMPNILPLLCMLACPVGMGLMMWLTMHNSKGETSSDASHEPKGWQRAVAPEAAPQTSMSPSEPSPLKAIWDCVQMCLNWKVLAGLAVVAVLVGIVALQFLWGAVP